MCFDSVVCAYRHRRRCHGKGHRRNQRAQSHRKDPFRFWAPHTHSFLFHVSSARFCSKNMFSLSRLFFFGITNMIGVDSCVFLIFTDKSLPENQTKRGEIDFFRTISKVLVYVFCSKRSVFEVVFFASHHNFWSTMAVVSAVRYGTRLGDLKNKQPTQRERHRERAWFFMINFGIFFSESLREWSPKKNPQILRVCHQAQIVFEVLGKRVFITNVKGTFLGMSESEEASKRR